MLRRVVPTRVGVVGASAAAARCASTVPPSPARPAAEKGYDTTAHEWENQHFTAQHFRGGNRMGESHEGSTDTSFMGPILVAVVATALFNIYTYEPDTRGSRDGY